MIDQEDVHIVGLEATTKWIRRRSIWEQSKDDPGRSGVQEPNRKFRKSKAKIIMFGEQINLRNERMSRFWEKFVQKTLSSNQFIVWPI